MKDNVDACIKKFNKREIYFYNMIDKFYKQCTPDTVKCMSDIINKTSNISLRILDWFVTRYSNKKKILIKNNDDVIDVHIGYKAQLKSYRKKYFDPFKRRTKFVYKFKQTSDVIYTTIGQLNFFRWAIDNNIIKYISDNYDELIKEMNLSNKDDKRKKKEKIISKNKRACNKKNIPNVLPNDGDKLVKINASKKIDSSNIHIVLSFD